MRKQRFNRGKLHLILLVIALLVVAGCSQNGNAGGEKAPSTESSQASPQASESGQPAEPPIELTISAPVLSYSFPPGFQEDPVMKELEKKLNVRLNVIPANAAGDVNAKFAAQLASGDLPDIASVPNAEMYAKIISAKAAYPMDELLEKHGQHIVNEAPYRIEYSRKMFSFDANGHNDGKLYFLNTGGDSSSNPLNVQAAPFLRYDLWKQLGYPKLETMDDYLPVLKQMMELEPVNSDGQKNYGVSGWFGDTGWGDWPLHTAFGMFEGRSMVDYWGDVDMNKQITPLLTNPDSYYWKAIEWFNKAYRMGVLDPDAFTMKWDQYLEKDNANRIFLGWFPGEGGAQKFIEEGTPEKGYFPMQAPNDGDDYVVSFTAPQGFYSFMISSNTKHPEKAMEVLDFLMSYEGTRLLTNGVEGVHWDEVDGKPKFKQEVLDGLKNDSDFAIKSGIEKYSNMAGRGADIIDPRFDIPLKYLFQAEYVAEKMTEVQKEGVAHFGVDLPSEVITKSKKNIYFDVSFRADLPAIPDDMKEEMKLIETNMQNYIKINQIKMIAIKSEEQFEEEKVKFIQELQKLGADKYYNWYQEGEH